MLKKTTEADAPLLAALLGAHSTSMPAASRAAESCATPAPLAEDVFTLRMRTAYRCYGAAHPQCAFYLAAPAQGEAQNVLHEAAAQVPDGCDQSMPHGVLCVQGRSALYSGTMHDADELEAFLAFLQVESFQSNSMLLPNWRPVPHYLMHLPAGGAVHVCAATVDEHPDLWALAHSGVLTGIDPEAWYADACSRTNNALADVRAIAVPREMRAQTTAPENTSGEEQANNAPPQYAATAGAYAIDAAGVYITAVETKEEYRGCGFGCTLISSLARAYADKDKWVLCKPALHGFYEQLGFVFARPVCEYRAPLAEPRRSVSQEENI